MVSRPLSALGQISQWAVWTRLIVCAYRAPPAFPTMWQRGVLRGLGAEGLFPMMMYALGVSAACYLVLIITGVLQDMPDAERAASICVSLAALAGVVAWAAERSARAQDARNGSAERSSENA